MKFSKQSWHYRLNYEWGSRFCGESTSLCAYFWTTVVSLLSILGIAVFLVWIAVVSLFALWAALYPITQVHPSVGGDLALGCVSIVVWLGIAIWVRYNYHHWFPWDSRWTKPIKLSREKEEEAKTRKKHPSLVGSWLKAKKEKVCPLVEFE